MFRFVDIRLALLLSAAVLLVRGQGLEDMPVGGCTLYGKMYNDKDVWKPEPCKTCVCNSGTHTCTEVICEGLSGCSNPIIPKGKCCPICPDDVMVGGCTLYGKMFRDKEVWKPDPCQICVCKSGTPKCTKVICEGLSGCSNPIIPDGQCCPICPDDGIKKGGNNATFF